MTFLHHMCIGVYLCVALYTRVQLSTETRRGWEVCWGGRYRYLGTTQHGYWKPCSGSLQRQHTWSAPETFLQSITLILRCGKKGKADFQSCRMLSIPVERQLSEEKGPNATLKESPCADKLNKSAFNSGILSRIIQINLLNQRMVSSFILIFFFKLSLLFKPKP